MPLPGKSCSQLAKMRSTRMPGLVPDTDSVRTLTRGRAVMNGRISCLSIPLFLSFAEALKSLLRCFVSRMVEDRGVVDQRAEEPVENEKTDSKILIHQTVIV